MIQQKQKKWLSTGIIIFLALFLFPVHGDAEDKKDNKVIENGDKVTLSYTLTVDKKVVDENNDLTFTQGAKEIVPGLDNKLKDMKIGQKKKITVKPEDGYGDIIKEAVIEIDKSKIPEKSHRVGIILEGKDPKTNRTINARVIEVKDKKIVVDLNHPLAGKTLVFDVEVMKIEKVSKK